jgi:hypothetical protein
MSTTLEPEAMPSPGQRWAIPAAAVLVLMGLALAFGGNQRPTLQPGTSYDASSGGFRAAYLLLEELGYPVKRSKHPTGHGARFVLLPTSTDKADELRGWIDRGGLVVLAVDSPDFASALGMRLKVENLPQGSSEQNAEGAGINRLAGGALEVSWPDEEGEAWCRAGGRPAITIHSQGAGEIWLLNRPEMFTNQNLKKCDNAILLCRLASEVERRRPGEVAFDEYFHGLRDRPGFYQLLFQPPAAWISAQALVLLALLLWHYVPRFGTLRDAASPRRRSKEEFLDAMASLLERKGDYQDAYRTSRRAFLHELEGELGLPAGTRRRQLLAAALRGRKRSRAAIRSAIVTKALPPKVSKAEFVNALNDLETARHELFQRRNHR